MISPELDRHIAEVGALFARRRTRRERIRAAVGAMLHTALAAGLVVLPLFGWVLACTLALRWGLRLAGVPEPAGAAHVGLACGVFAWVLHMLCEQEEEED